MMDHLEMVAVVPCILVTKTTALKTVHYQQLWLIVHEKRTSTCFDKSIKQLKSAIGKR